MSARKPCSAWNCYSASAVTLGAVADIVNRNSGLKIHVLQLAHDTTTPETEELSLDQCIVEIGIERLRESLRQTRFRLKPTERTKIVTG